MVRPPNVDNAILQAFTKILQNQQEANNNVDANPPVHQGHRQGSFAWVASQMSRSHAKTYGGEVDPVALSEWFRDMEKSFTLYEVEEQDKVKLVSNFLVREAYR